MGDYNKEEGESYAKLEKIFTQEQVEALINYVEFKIKYEGEWVTFSDSELEKKLMYELRRHRHLNDGDVVMPL